MEMQNNISYIVYFFIVILECTIAQDGQVPDISDDPIIFESDSLPGNMQYMASVGNGHIASNIFGDTVFMNGLYSGDLGLSHRARIPSYHSSFISLPADPTATHRYRLDTQRAVFEDMLTGAEADVVYRVYAHQFYTRALITEVFVQRTGPTGTPITINRERITIDEDSPFDLILNDTLAYESVISGCSPAGETTCSQRDGIIREPETETSGNPPVFMYWRAMPDTFTLAADETENTWTYVLSVDGDKDIAQSEFDQVMELVNNGQATDLLSSHTSAWQEVWDSGSIDIEGDISGNPSLLTLSKVIRGSLYYLYSNLPSRNTSSPRNLFYGLSPGGLANGEFGRDYYGHMFWDMETWMYPAILYFRPDLAREMLSYRISGMDPAFDRAASGGYEGTRFPWESAYTGVEVTPDVCVPCRENQQHITADIAFAARQYISATRNTTWLNTPQADTQYTGFDFLYYMANFWYTRPTFDLEKDKYEINGVMPPDEHQQSINNSVYTNVGASLSIHFARYASCLAGRDPIEDIPDRWINVAQSLFFPFNTERRYHEEFEGYEYYVQANLTDEDFVKQADVVLLGFPFLWEMPDDVRRNDLLEYENVTAPGGPAMTWGMFATGWLDVDEDVKAAELFDRSYQRYYREPFKIWTEAQEGAGAINFITGQGGFLQALVSGYGGLRLYVEELRFRTPKLPPGVTKLNVRGLHYLGNKLDYSVSTDEVTLGVVQGGGLPLTVYLNDGSNLDLTEGVMRTFNVQNFNVNSTTPTNCPLPQDNIDVDYGVDAEYTHTLRKI